jgi:hypothetical protein
MWEQLARTADFAVRVFSVAIVATVPYSIAVSKLRRPFLSDRYFFIVVRLLRRREKLTEPDFALLARAFNRARALHPFCLSPQPGAGRFGQAPGRLAMVKLQRTRRHERRRTKRTLWFDRRPRANALRSARTNLSAPSRGREDADHKSGAPRYPLVGLHNALEEANIKHVFYESPGTAYEWETWRRDLKDFAPRLFQQDGK